MISVTSSCNSPPSNKNKKGGHNRVRTRSKMLLIVCLLLGARVTQATSGTGLRRLDDAAVEDYQ